MFGRIAIFKLVFFYECYFWSSLLEMCLRITFLNYISSWIYVIQNCIVQILNYFLTVGLNTCLAMYKFQRFKKLTSCSCISMRLWTLKKILISSEKLLNGTSAKRKWSARRPERVHLPPAQHFIIVSVLVYCRLLSYFPRCLCIKVLLLQNIAIGIPVT